jgi:hypothetical protein
MRFGGQAVTESMRKTEGRKASPGPGAGRGLRKTRSAERWARAALRKILTPEDWKHYVICEEVLVSGKLGTYVVTPGVPIIFQPERRGRTKRRARFMKVVFGQGKVPPSDDVLIKVLWLRHNEKGVWASVPTTPIPSPAPPRGVTRSRFYIQGSVKCLRLKR